ncbi:hypothetical protein [Sulfobacillus thermosulfidooxidans]|uniref:hypothetical protein n=1 Tax=Sulfobacillus thermosulfidooxidans TaxID=28034 RepID=UPI00036F65DF|nr:hypothetical protein [Sulfobacillus thermosulfidooxidans]
MTSLVATAFFFMAHVEEGIQIADLGADLNGHHHEHRDNDTSNAFLDWVGGLYPSVASRTMTIAWDHAL